MKKITGVFMIVIAIVLVGYAAEKYLPRLMDYKKSRETYEDLNDKYTSDPELESEQDPKWQDTAGILQQGSMEGAGLESLYPQAVLDTLADIVPGDPGDYIYKNIDGEGLLNENPDYLGWIYVPKTDISYPVVYSEDNADYLHTNFFNEYSFAGTIFMDYRCKKGVLNHHTVLYGHNMRDGSMFAQLNKYKEQDFTDEHPVFWFITPEYSFLYQVFSVCSPNPYDKAQYGVDLSEYKNNEDFDDAIQKMLEQSVIETDIEPNGRDYIMSLSTCTGNSSVRCLVHGKLLGAKRN